MSNFIILRRHWNHKHSMTCHQFICVRMIECVTTTFSREITLIELNKVYLWPFRIYVPSRDKVGKRMRKNFGQIMSWRDYPGICLIWLRTFEKLLEWSAVAIEPRTFRMQSQRSINWATTAPSVITLIFASVFSPQFERLSHFKKWSQWIL